MTAPDHFNYGKLIACVAASLGMHFFVERGLETLPPWIEQHPPQKIEIRLVAPPEPLPEPEPPKVEPPPKPEPPKPQPAVHEVPRPHPVKAIEQAPVPKDVTPVEHPPAAIDTGSMVFNGGNLESVSQGGTGPALPIGKGGGGQPAGAVPGPTAGPKKPIGEPAAAYEVTKMPLPQGRCAGKYTDEAREAAIEGTVVLELVVGEDGRARDIKVVSGLGHGLTEAAIAALKACQFSPGEKDGHAVAVKVREFKIRFLMQDAS